VRKLGVALAALGVVLSAFASAGLARGDQDAAAPSASATMTCERVESPGRVRCEVEARVGAGEAINWGDVVILKTPPFASALRGRIGPHDATVHDPGVWRWALALVARDKGGGDVEGRVRLVVCKGDRCGPREIDVKGRMQVGD
jgi:hypothetical protein